MIGPSYYDSIPEPELLIEQGTFVRVKILRGDGSYEEHKGTYLYPVCINEDGTETHGVDTYTGAGYVEVISKNISIIE